MQFTEADCFWGSQGQGGEVWVDGAIDMKLESAKVHNLKFNHIFREANCKKYCKLICPHFQLPLQWRARIEAVGGLRSSETFPKHVL